MINAMANEQLINKVIYLMQNDDSADAPKDSIKWAKDIFRSKAARPKSSLVERIFAVLQADLLPSIPAFGERSASASAARQMLFEAGENSVDLRISRSGEAFKLAGQVLGEGFQDSVVRLGDFESSADEMSEFEFAAIPSGEYGLTITKAGKEIVIGKFLIG